MLLCFLFTYPNSLCAVSAEVYSGSCSNTVGERSAPVHCCAKVFLATHIYYSITCVFRTHVLLCVSGHILLCVFRTHITCVFRTHITVCVQDTYYCVYQDTYYCVYSGHILLCVFRTHITVCIRTHTTLLRVCSVPTIIALPNHVHTEGNHNTSIVSHW